MDVVNIAMYYTLRYCFCQGGLLKKKKEDEKFKPISVYVPNPMHTQLVGLAKRERRTVSAQIVVLLERALEPRKGQ